MAVLNLSQGYNCEFVDQADNSYYCNKCSLVARRLTITSCCGKSFCHTCIAEPVKKDLPCPTCKERKFETLEQVKSQEEILNLIVYCNMKRKGCGWSGTLKDLDTHLDPEENNCQYVDTKCPLNCQKTITKNEVEHDVAKECFKREYSCQHCSFMATYEEVVNKHLPECNCVPLQCLNLCGASFDQKAIEDHLKICPLEIIACDFSAVGCEQKFEREKREEHIHEKVQQHLSLTALQAVASHQDLQLQCDKFMEIKKEVNQNGGALQDVAQQQDNQRNRLEELENKIEEDGWGQYREGEEMIRKDIQDIQNVIKQQKQKLVDLEKALEWEKCEKKVIIAIAVVLLAFLAHLASIKVQQLQQDFNEEGNRTIQQLCALNYHLGEEVKIENLVKMKNFNAEKLKGSYWRSPTMYTHVCGYRFYLYVYPNGSGYQGNVVDVAIGLTSGMFDGSLTWPAKATFTVELVNSREVAVANTSTKVTWKKPGEKYDRYLFFKSYNNASEDYLISHSKLKKFLSRDSLTFRIRVEFF